MTSSSSSKPIAIVNIVAALILIAAQITFYILPWVGTIVWASTGIWGGAIIIVSSLLVLINKGSKAVRASLCALAALVGILIVAWFSYNIDDFRVAGSYGYSCSELLACDLLTVEAFFISGGAIATLMSGILFVMVIKSNN